MKIARISAIVAAAVFAIETSSAAAATALWNVVDSVGTFGDYQFSSVDGFPGLGNGGHVVFAATTNLGVHGVFAARQTSAGDEILLLVDDTGVYNSFATGVGFINGLGVAAVTATRDDGEKEIFTVDLNGNVTPLVDTTGSFNTLSTSPDINDAGTVAFRGELDSGVTGVFTASAATELNAVNEIDTSAGEFDAFFTPSINNGGDVLYLGNDIENEVNRLIVAAADGTQTIAQTAPFGEGILPYDLSDNGDIAYVFNDSAAGERSVIVMDPEASTMTPFIEPGDGFSLTPPPNVTLNASGKLAFSDDSSIVVAGPDGFDTLLEDGDSAFGGTLLAAFMGKGFNDANQAAFIYALTDGTSGIGVARSQIRSGDFNDDGVVDGQDFLIWQSGFGIVSDATRADGDGDGDGDVDGEDFLQWQSNFSPAESGAAAATPEPTGAALAMLICAAAAVVRTKLR